MLAICPPYPANPWLGIGIPLIASILAKAEIRSRIVRFLDDRFGSPLPLAQSAIDTLWNDVSIERRLSEIDRLVGEFPEFFDDLVATLLAGPERVFGFSVWRHNADVTLELARRLKRLRPGCLIVLGGPEAIESPGDLMLPCVDVIVKGSAEALVVQVMESVLAGRVADLGVWEDVWINPRFEAEPTVERRKAPSTPPIPTIDYTDVIPLLVGDPRATIPVILNIGCPLRCAFCTNTTVYPTMEWSRPERLLGEMQQISRLWLEIHGDGAPPLHLELCDATFNSWPDQFDELCDGIVASDWPIRPEIRGCFIVDSRITPQRVEKYVAAGVLGCFFGLETASPRLRRAMKKPGTIETVAKALETIRDVGQGKLRVTSNVIVGWPGETEDDYYETVAFLEWVAGQGIIDNMSVMPLCRTPGAMDKELLADATGARRGFAWRSDGPAGSPSVRCRRFLSVFERFQGVMQISSIIPRDLLMRWMMPEMPREFVEAWCRVHGSVDTYFLAATRPGDDEADSQVESLLLNGAADDRAPLNVASQRFAADVESLLAPRLRGAVELTGGWRLDGFFNADPHEAVVVQFSRDAGHPVGLQLTPRREDAPAFFRSAQFNVSYLREFAGVTYAEDLSVVRSIVDLIVEAEAGPALDA